VLLTLYPGFSVSEILTLFFRYLQAQIAARRFLVHSNSKNPNVFSHSLALAMLVGVFVLAIARLFPGLVP
jgi:hypothetical protein